MAPKLRVPEGKVFSYLDGIHNSKDFLDMAVSRSYLLIIKPKKRNPSRFGAKIREMVYRSICEGLFSELDTPWDQKVRRIAASIIVSLLPAGQGIAEGQSHHQPKDMGHVSYAVSSA